MANFHKEIKVNCVNRSTGGRCCAETEVRVRVPTEGFCHQKMFKCRRELLEAGVGTETSNRQGRFMSSSLLNPSI